MCHRFGLTLGVVLFLGCLLGADEPATQPAATQPPPQTRKHIQIEVPPADSLPTSQPSKADEIPRDTLVEMYARELGKTYNPADLDRIHDAHALLESYFAEPTARARQDIVSKLRDTKLDPALVGRLARLRMYWPALQPGVYYTNERHGPHDVRYFLGVPKTYDRAKPWPLVIKLPTATAFLTDPMPGPERVTQIYSEWIKSEIAEHPDALVLMPLLNLDELYGPSQPGMNTVIQPMLHAAGRANIDPARVYLIGHSMAGHATWNLALHYPTYFAAINPLAGGASGDWQRLRLMNLSNVLPVVWHDATDDVVKVGFSRSLVKVLQDLKIDVDYEETKTAGHAPPPDVVKRTYEKLRARTRELYPKSVNLQSNRPETIFNRADWLQIYQPLAPGKGRRLMLRKGTGPIRTYERAYSARAAITAGNRIEIRTDNVATLRLYLNDQLVNLAKPITVLVNNKTRFEGLATIDVDAMLKDQLFLGRGWRYYTATIDIDLAPMSSSTTTKPTTRPLSRPATRPAR